MEAEIAKLKKIDRNPIKKQAELEKIAQKDRDAAGFMKVQGEMAEAVQEMMQKLTSEKGEINEETVGEIKEEMKGKMGGMLEHLNQAVQQAQAHMSAADKKKQQEMIQQLKQSGFMGPMAGMLEDVLAGKPLDMEDLEVQSREMMYEQQRAMEEAMAAEAALEEKLELELEQEEAEEESQRFEEISLHQQE